MTRKLTDKEQRVKDMVDALSTPKYSKQWMLSIPNWANVNIYGYQPKEYQQPERDEQGTFYAYKVLLFRQGKFISPQYPVTWNPDGSLEADRVPTTANRNGIYATKTVNDSELKSYMIRHSDLYYPPYRENFRPVIVYIALSGTVIEAETGFRASRAQIIEILDEQRGWMNYEHWRDYKNSQEYSRSNPSETSEKRKYWYGEWYETP